MCLVSHFCYQTGVSSSSRANRRRLQLSFVTKVLQFSYQVSDTFLLRNGLEETSPFGRFSCWSMINGNGILHFRLEIAVSGNDQTVELTSDPNEFAYPSVNQWTCGLSRREKKLRMVRPFGH